jgi:hypothetical protein
MSERTPTLVEEARYLHDSLFRAPLDASVVKRYEAAHGELFPDEATSLPVARLVSRKLDVEAVEFALRRRGCGAQLTRKIQILCYLVEVRAAYQSYFVATKTERVKAAILLMAALLRTVWKRGKGEYLVRRHGML